MFGQEERIDPNEQAQILTTYVNAGITTRNEARVKLGQASVEDPAANALMVTTGAGAAPLVDEPAHDIAKAYDPNEPRDARGRWTTGPYGQPETPKAQTKPAGVHVAAEDAGATMFLGFMAAAAAMVAAGNAAREALDRHKSRNEPPPPVPSSKPQEEKADKPPHAVPQTPAAAAPAPEPEPSDKKEREKPPTIRPSQADLQRLVDEHNKGLKLTMKAAERIVEETQPEGTKPTIVGEHVPGPDILYEDAAGARVKSVEVRTAENIKQAEKNIYGALKKNDAPDVVAAEIPKEADVPSPHWKDQEIQSELHSGEIHHNCGSRRWRPRPTTAIPIGEIRMMSLCMLGLDTFETMELSEYWRTQLPLELYAGPKIWPEGLGKDSDKTLYLYPEHLKLLYERFKAANPKGVVLTADAGVHDYAPPGLSQAEVDKMEEDREIFVDLFLAEEEFGYPHARKYLPELFEPGVIDRMDADPWLNVHLLGEAKREGHVPKELGDLARWSTEWRAYCDRLLASGDYK